jgi:hypothetical protein
MIVFVLVLILISHVATQCAPSCVNCVNSTVCLECQDGYWNEHCLHTCPRRCRGACDRSDGRCFECQDGYYGSECDQFCPLTCKRAPDAIADRRVGGPCVAHAIVRTTAPSAQNSNSTDTDVSMTTVTNETTSDVTTTLAPTRTPLPTLEALQPYEVRLECTLGCTTGMFSPSDGCRSMCPLRCATAHGNRSFSLHAGDCVPPPPGSLIVSGICTHGCQLGYGGPSCNVSCGTCATPEDPLTDSCSANGTCSNGCVASKHGMMCTFDCHLGCENKSGCDQLTGQCFQCKPGLCGTGCLSTSACVSQSCVLAPISGEAPYGANCGPCHVGAWGSLCEQLCPSRCVGGCDKLTGECRGGCARSYFGKNCEHGPVPLCRRPFQNGSCEVCDVFHWGQFCNESCSMCDWSVTEIPENVLTACHRWTGECTIGCERCDADKIVLWVMLSIFVFFPITIALFYLACWLALRHKMSASEQKEVELKQEETKEAPTPS